MSPQALSRLLPPDSTRTTSTPCRAAALAAAEPAGPPPLGGYGFKRIGRGLFREIEPQRLVAAWQLGMRESPFPDEAVRNLQIASINCLAARPYIRSSG
jgi:hypothetical protein